MTENFIEIEKEENKNIHTLLLNEKIKDFKEYIGYKEKETIKYLIINNTLYDFLLSKMTFIDWPDYI